MQTDILVLEDDPLVGRALARQLRPYGDVHTAASLTEAYALLPRMPALRAAVVDWMLPDGDGGEFLERLAGVRRVPCLVVTGHLDHRVINAAQSLGAHVAIKPVNDDNIRAFMEAALSRARALDAALDTFVEMWGLTRRHREIIRRGAAGVARRELSDDLGIAESTLKAHIRTMLKRTGADDYPSMVQDILLRALRLDTQPHEPPPDSGAPPRGRN